MAKDFENWASFIGRISQSVAKSLQPLQSLNQKSKHLEIARLAAQAGTSMFHKFPAMEDLCSPVPKEALETPLCPSPLLLKSLAVTGELKPYGTHFGVFQDFPKSMSGFTTITQKTVLNSPLHQAAQQAHQRLLEARVSMTPDLESMRLAAEASTSIRPFLESIKPVSESLASLAGPIFEVPISPLFREFADAARTGRLYKSFLQELRDLPEFLRRLAKSGWYLSDRLYDEMPWDFADVVENGDREKIDRIIIECLQKQLDSIKYEIIDNYPERRGKLSEGFHAHKLKMYNCCSIQAFLSQAEGIFKDKFGGGIFTWEERIKVAKKEIDLSENSISYVESLLSNDADTLPGSSRSKNLYDLDSCIRRGFLLRNDFNGLERNSIMHGDSGYCGNELKSLKAISFLDWIHCLERERESRQE